MIKQVLICQYPSCLSKGSAEVLAAFLAASSPEEVAIVPSECHGQCNLGTSVRILPDEVWYCRVQSQDVHAIAAQHLQQGHPVEKLLHPRIHARY